MGTVNPQDLTLPPRADEEQEEDEGPADEYEVERILDYEIRDLETMGVPLYEWESEDTRWEVRYWVKWKGYEDPAERTWEPRRNFLAWDATFDGWVEDVRKSKNHKRVEQLEQAAKKRNADWVKTREEAKKVEAKRLTGAALLQGKGKKRAKAPEKEKVKVKKERGKGKAVEKEKPKKGRSSTLAEASPAPSASSSTGRGTRRSRLADSVFTPEAIADMAKHGNLPPELRGLQRTPPPKKDADGNFIYSSGDEQGSVSPTFQQMSLDQKPSQPPQQYDPYAASAFASTSAYDPYAQHPFAAFPYNQPGYVQTGYAPVVASNAAAHGGFAGSDDEDEHMADAEQPSFAADSGFNGSTTSGRPAQSGFAGDSDDEAEQQQQQPAAASASGGGFAGSSDDEADGGGADASAAGDSMQLDGLGGSASQRGREGFAGDDSSQSPEPPWASRAAAPPPAPAAATNGFAGSPTPEPGFAGDDSPEPEDVDGAEIAPEPAAPAAVVGFAGSDDEGGGAGGFAGSDEEDEVEKQGAQGAQATGFAGSDDEGAPTGGGGFAGSDEEDEADATAAAPLAAARTAGVVTSSATVPADETEPSKKESKEERAACKAAKKAAKAEKKAKKEAARAEKEGKDQAEKGDGADEGKKRERAKKLGGEKASSVAKPAATPNKDDVPVKRDSKKAPAATVVKVTPAASRRSSSSASTRAPPVPAPVQESRGAPQPPRKKPRIVDSEDEDEEPAPLSSTLAQLPKIRKAVEHTAQGPPSRHSSRQPSEGAPGAAATTGSASVTRPSPAPTGGSLGSSSQAQSSGKIWTPWTQTADRPNAENGFVKINPALLRQQKLAAGLVRNSKFSWPGGMISDIDKIRFLWRIGTNPLDGTANFDDLLLNHDQPREVYITEMPTESEAGRNKFAKRARADYLALQMVLSALDGVKQADAPRSSVGAVFVHVSKLPELGKFPGKLQELEMLRQNEEVVFFAYGETTEGVRVFRRIWLRGFAVTFTAEAAKQNHTRLNGFVQQLDKARGVFPWIPVQYFLPGGDFGQPIDDDGNLLPPTPETDTDKRAARHALSALVALDTLALVNTGRDTRQPPNEWPVFPSFEDRLPFRPSEWSKVIEGYPVELRELGVERLQQVVCWWRSFYPQLRRWVVIASPEEIASCPPSRGIDLVTFDEAEKLLLPS
ncbi:hypothetical protein JCM8097_007024 [Rhodosporidiobolus ruineniae]